MSRIDLQGAGTYTYECNKMDCIFCQTFGLTPKLLDIWQPVVKKKIKLLPVKNNSKRRYKHWRESEIAILLNNPFKSGRSLRKELRRFKIHSISAKMSRLRANGFLPPLEHAKDHPATNKENYEPEKKRKATPKKWVEPDWLAQYRKDRDFSLLNNLFTDEQTKDEIREKYGIKSNKLNNE